MGYKTKLAVGEHMVSFNRVVLLLLEPPTGSSAVAAHATSMLETMHAIFHITLFCAIVIFSLRL